MVKTFQIDNELYERFVKATAHAHNGNAFGHVASEHRAAIEDRIKKLEENASL